MTCVGSDHLSLEYILVLHFESLCNGERDSLYLSTYSRKAYQSYNIAFQLEL